MAESIFPKIKYEKPKTDSSLESLLSTQSENLSARLGAVGAPVDDRNILGRVLNLEQDQNFFFDVLEVLDRPGQAIKGLIAPEEGDDPFTGFFRGLAGQTDRTGTEFLVDAGVLGERELERMEGFTKFALDFGVDLLTDPLTYLPAGTIAKTLDKLNPFAQKKLIDTMVANIDTVKAAKRTAIADTTKSLVESGMTETAALKKAKELAGITDETKLLNNVKKSKKAIKQLRKKINDLTAQGQSQKQIMKELSATEVEVLAYDEFFTKFEKAAKDMNIAGANYKIARFGGSAPGTPDVQVFIDIDGEYFRVASLEVKQAGKGFARGTTVKFAKNVKKGTLTFGDNVKLADNLKTTIQQKWGKISITVGQGADARVSTIADEVTALVEGAQQGAKGSFALSNPNMYRPEDLAQIQEAARDIIRSMDWDYMYVVARDGTSGFARKDAIVDLMDIKINVRASEAGQKAGKVAKEIQTRMYVDIGLDSVATLPAAGYDDLWKQVFGAEAIRKEVVQKVGFLSWAAEKDYFFSDAARRALEFKKAFVKKFNPFAYLSDEAKSLIRRLPAESQQILTQEGRRITALAEEAIRRAPNGNEIIQELIEAGAKLVDGKVVIDTTRYNMGHVLRLFNDEYLKNGDELFIPVYGGRTADNVLQQLNRTYKKATGIDDAFQLINRDGKNFLSLNLLDPDTFRGSLRDSSVMAIIDGTQLGVGRKQLTDEMADFLRNNEDLVGEYSKAYDDIIDMFRKELGPENMPDVFKTTNGYSRHVLSREGAEWMKGNQPLARSKYVQQGVDFLAQRKYLGTTDDINDAMKVYYDIDFDFFDPQVNQSLADLLRVGVTKNESGKILNIILKNSDDAGVPLFQVIDNKATASLGPGYKNIDSFESEFSKLYSNLAPDAQKVLDDFLIGQGFGKGKAIAINDVAYETLKRFENAYVEVPQLLKNYDKVLNQWKGLNLVTPSFHLNNFFGNSVNSFLAGMGVAQQSVYLGRAGTDLASYDRILTQLDGLIASGLRRDEAIKALSKADLDSYNRLLYYLESGASMKGRGVRDLGGVGKTLEEGGQKGLYRELLEANFNLAENADELQRFALFQWAFDTELSRLTKAGNLTEQAALMKARTFAENKVFETLFDYSHFTRFEQDVMKRLIPFYTFAKNNLVFQMRNIIRNPAQYNKLGRAYNYYVSDIAGLSKEDMPDYARGNMWLPIPINVGRGDKETITFLKANLPPAEFGELIESRGARVVSSLTVPLKLPIELALNRDIFTGAQIKEFPGQKDRMEAGTGVASFFRDEQGMATLSADPVIQKIVNDLGGRVPARYITTALGIADAATGYKDPEDAFAEALNSLGILSIRETEDIRVTNLYQALEKYRNAEKLWEQENGMDLPTKKELGLP